MHGLVQLAVPLWLESRGNFKLWRDRFVAILAEEFPTGACETWKVCRLLLPHVEQTSKNESVTASLDSAGKCKYAGVLANAAWYVWSQGLFLQAEQLAKVSFELRERELGTEHADTLASVNILALVLERQGKYETAEQMNLRALAGREKELGANHPDTLTSVYCLALLLASMSYYEEAQVLYQRACLGFKTVLGVEHATTLACQRHYTELQAIIRRSQTSTSGRQEADKRATSQPTSSQLSTRLKQFSHS